MTRKIWVLVFVACVTGCTAEPTSSTVASALCTIEDQEAGLCDPYQPPPVVDVTVAPPTWSLPTTAAVGLPDNLAVSDRQQLFDYVGNLSYGWSNGSFAADGPDGASYLPGGGPIAQCGGDDSWTGCSFRQTGQDDTADGKVRVRYDWTCWVHGPWFAGYCMGAAVVTYNIIGGDLFIALVNSASGHCGRGTLRC